jgi:hypothetical protein
VQCECAYSSGTAGAPFSHQRAMTAAPRTNRALINLLDATAHSMTTGLPSTTDSSPIRPLAPPPPHTLLRRSLVIHLRSSAIFLSAHNHKLQPHLIIPCRAYRIRLHGNRHLRHDLKASRISSGTVESGRILCMW